MRVMTWNVAWRFEGWQQRRHAIRRLIERVNPDICALQEVWADDRENLAGWLADQLGMQSAWGPTAHNQRWREMIGEPSVEFGVAVLSRYPIGSYQCEELPADTGRPMLTTHIDGPSGRIPFITAHLSAGGKKAAARREQAHHLRAVMADARSADHPAILAADCNAAPECDEIRILAGFTGDCRPDLNLVDSWRYADPGDPGFTWDRRNPHVADAPDPSARIDYIFTEIRYDVAAGAVQSVELTALEPIDGVWATDHAALVATLS
jgi:endonuclease/exonuclease/phosphatase family metal-dependent hydrolase